MSNPTSVELKLRRVDAVVGDVTIFSRKTSVQTWEKPRNPGNTRENLIWLNPPYSRIVNTNANFKGMQKYNIQLQNPLIMFI